MRKVILLLAMGLSALGCGAKSNKESGQPSRVSTSPESTSDNTPDSLHYEIKRATEHQGEVLLVLLHGYGSNEGDLMGLAQLFPSNFTLVSLRATYTMQPGSYQWYQSNSSVGKYDGDSLQLAQSRTLIEAMVTGLQKSLGVGAAQTFIAGFSQGANMSYQMGLLYPGLCNGVGILSGTLFESTKQAIAKTNNTQLGIFVGHGDKDNRITYAAAVESVSWLKKLKFNPDFHSYANMAHSISQPEINDFLQFIQNRIKK